jgi:cold shock CspA family protein
VTEPENPVTEPEHPVTDPRTPRARREPQLGKVTAFDEERGLGTVLGDDGSELPFHCTSIAGGSRRIPAGARVAFSTAAGHLGKIEAVGVTVVTLSANASG